MQEQSRYSILGEIGSGATASVYLAEDNVLKRKVALKWLHPHLLNQAETVRRFEKEAVAVASLSHENIIRIFDFGNYGKGRYLAMEYVDGIPLDQLLEEPPRKLPNLVALSVFHQLMQGLRAAHEKGIFHRDIKPSNILVDRKGCVRIADFGIAFLAQENSATKTGSYLGTPQYSAPEQAEGNPSSDKTDIFSAGIVLYRGLTGKLPFEGETSHALLLAVIEKQAPKPVSVNPVLLPGFAPLLEALLTKAPARRPDAGECLARLEAVARQAGFAIETDRVRRFMEAPEIYARLENEEIAAAFRRRAEVLTAGGEIRKAMKLESLSEVFAQGLDASPRALASLEGTGSKNVRATVISACALLILAVAAAWWTLHSRGETPKPASVPARVENPAPMPPEPEARARDSLPPSPAPSNPPTSVAAPRTRTVKGKPVVQYTIKHGAYARRAAAAPVAPVWRPPASPSPSAEPAPGYLVVKTNPPFATLFVDGRSAGSTPTKIPLPLAAGAHDLTLERKGCTALRVAIEITSSDTAYLRYTLEKSGDGP